MTSRSEYFRRWNECEDRLRDAIDRIASEGREPLLHEIHALDALQREGFRLYTRLAACKQHRSNKQFIKRLVKIRSNLRAAISPSGIEKHGLFAYQEIKNQIVELCRDVIGIVRFNEWPIAVSEKKDFNDPLSELALFDEWAAIRSQCVVWLSPPGIDIDEVNAQWLRLVARQLRAIELEDIADDDRYDQEITELEWQKRRLLVSVDVGIIDAIVGRLHREKKNSRFALDTLLHSQ